MEALFHNQAFWNAVGIFMGILVSMAGASLAIRVLSKNLRMAVYYWRQFEPKAIAATNEPSDPIIKKLSALTKLPPELYVAFLPVFFKALGDGLDAALVQSVKEVKITESTAGNS